MNENEIRRYASLMKELDLSALEITDEQSRRLRLERACTAAPAAAPVIQAAAAPAASAPAESAGDDYISVISPIVGVFHAAPAENADPFVRPGERVEKGAVLCIIEAMKLMNEICAEESGVIEKICVASGQIVEYGTELFRLRR